LVNDKYGRREDERYKNEKVPRREYAMLLRGELYIYIYKLANEAIVRKTSYPAANLKSERIDWVCFVVRKSKKRNKGYINWEFRMGKKNISPKFPEE